MSEMHIYTRDLILPVALSPTFNLLEALHKLAAVQMWQSIQARHAPTVAFWYLCLGMSSDVLRLLTEPWTVREEVVSIDGEDE